MSPIKDLLFASPSYQKIYQGFFEQERAQNIENTGDYQVTFIPQINNQWGKAGCPRVIWCGASTYGWTGGKEYFENRSIKARETQDQNWMDNAFSNRQQRSLFWRLQRKVLNEMNAGYPNSIWNNYIKLGGDWSVNRGNARGANRTNQLHLCKQAFDIELKILKPKLVVLHVGRLLDDVFDDITVPWKYWDKVSKGRILLAAHTRYDGIPFIWLSRRIGVADKIYLDAFEECLVAQGAR